MRFDFVVQTGTGDGATLLWYVASVVLAAWTYRDAKRNSEYSPLLLAAIVFFTSVVGFGLYWLFGRSATPSAAGSTGRAARESGASGSSEGGRDRNRRKLRVDSSVQQYGDDE